MLDISPSDPLIKGYLRDIQRLRNQEISHELGLKGPFQNLLDRTAKRRGWILVPELSTYSGGRRVVPDGTVRDEFRLPRGWWEAKDTGDNLALEIDKKLKAGYPTRNTIFEDTEIAILYQDRADSEFTLREPAAIAELLNRFYAHDEADERELQRAMADFKSRIPDLAQSLLEHVSDAHKNNRLFRDSFREFVSLCRSSLNPELSEDKVDEMLIQHLLTERLMRNLFQNPEFTQRNVIAVEVEKVIQALSSGSFSKAGFLRRLDPYYKAIERAATNLDHFTEKQDFLNSVYEQFFQRFSPNVADTHGIVYTPREIVDYMCRSVEQALQEEFGKTLASPDVVILDPCTGTGNFLVNLIQRIPGPALRDAYERRLFANEVMLLPYYIASLNVEHAYYDRMGHYRPFEGLCFVDTLDMADSQQIGLFTAENTERVARERSAQVTVIIGNPPYNVGQKSENDNNKNRRYLEVDQWVRETYGKDSTATNKNSLGDMYVKFFRWASNRLGKRDGIVCFVSNNSFVDQVAFDGMRKHLANDFHRIDHIDLHGNVRRNPKLSGTVHNVFGIQVGVGITLALRKKGARRQIRYHRVPERWRKSQKLEFLVTGAIPWQQVCPSDDHAWVLPEHHGEYSSFLSIEDVFETYTVGVKTNRDDVVYDWNRNVLSERIRSFVAAYNADVYRHKADAQAEWNPAVKWSRDLKLDAVRGRIVAYDESRIRESLYRPFTRKWLYFDRVLNEEVYQWMSVAGPVICVTSHTQVPFSLIMTDIIPNEAPGGRQGQCLPLMHIKPSAVETLRQASGEEDLNARDVFEYVYGVLHHAEFRLRYQESLRRELPRIPLAPDLKCFAAAGKELARLHVGYESLEPWPLKFVENMDVPYSEAVAKMKLAEDKQAIVVNESLTLAGIPPEVFEYRIGNRSALEWVIDQYQVKGESNPNWEDDPGYVVRLVGQVIRVSVETVKIVNELSKLPFKS